jgi:RimJ/RimL family protein N-acetyltransferase
MDLPALTDGRVSLRPRPAPGDGWTVAADGDEVGRLGLATCGHDTAVVSVAIEEPARNRGTGTAALRAAAGWLLSTAGLRRLEHRAAFADWAALRLGEKAGFAYEGLLRGAAATGDVWLSARLAGDDGGERALSLPQPWLHGGAVTLRPYDAGDEADLAAGGADPLTQCWITTMPAAYTLEDARWWITRGSVEDRATGEAVNFAIAENTTGRLVGGIGLHHRDGVRRIAEVGYWLAPWGRGKGYATEATRVVCRWGMSALGLRRINLMAAVGNDASQRVAERAGFTRVGVVRSAAVARDSSPLDMVLFERVGTG